MEVPLKNQKGRLNMASLMANYAILASSLKENGFSVKDGRLKTLVSDLWSSGPHTFIVHLGDRATVHSRNQTDGVTTKVVGDKTNKLITIIDHGTGLSGPISVYMSVTEDNEDQLIHLTMEVYPISDLSENLLGVIWMDDIQSIGVGGRLGQTVTVSVDQLLMPDRRFCRTAFTGTMCQFTLGITTAVEFMEDSKIVISQFMGDAIVVTPFGVRPNNIVDMYGILNRKLISQPIGLSDTRFAILKVIFEEQVSIFNQKAVRSILTWKGLDEDEIVKIIHLFNNMAKQGEWLTSMKYAEDIYYIPTTKLLTSI